MIHDINAGLTRSIDLSFQTPAKSDCSNKMGISEVISMDVDEYISNETIKMGQQKDIVSLEEKNLIN